MKVLLDKLEYVKKYGFVQIVQYLKINRMNINSWSRRKSKEEKKIENKIKMKRK